MKMSIKSGSWFRKLFNLPIYTWISGQLVESTILWNCLRQKNKNQIISFDYTSSRFSSSKYVNGKIESTAYFSALYWCSECVSLRDSVLAHKFILYKKSDMWLLHSVSLFLLMLTCWALDCLDTLRLFVIIMPSLPTLFFLFYFVLLSFSLAVFFFLFLSSC